MEKLNKYNNKIKRLLKMEMEYCCISMEGYMKESLEIISNKEKAMKCLYTIIILIIVIIIIIIIITILIIRRRRIIKLVIIIE